MSKKFWRFGEQSHRQRSPRYRLNWAGQSIVSFPGCPILLGITLLLIIWGCLLALHLRLASTQPIGAYLVLGGSINREYYVAEQSKRHPTIPILISQGSPDPCIWEMFEQMHAPVTFVWLEKCARSTFDNFHFSIPILQQWHTQRVRVITSQSHLPRAKWMAQILLGAQGMWVDVEVAPEQGVPGNDESWVKTGLDVTRSLLWAIASQVYHPRCFQSYPLAKIDRQQWQLGEFRCEHQGKMKF